MDEGKRLIKELGKARSEMERAVSVVDAQKEICPGWTVKEVLAHIGGWDAVGTSTVRAHLAGKQPPPLEARGIDAYNAYVVAGCETLTHEQVIEDWRGARRQLTDALTEAPSEKLRDRVRFPWGETGTIAWYMSILVEHEREHATEIMEMDRLGWSRGGDGMKRIVITGSTRGIGYGLSDAFLERGCSVTISGRSQEAVDRASAELGARHGAERLFGQPCDVTDFDQVQALWDAAKDHWGRIDIWINNAGIAHAQMPLWKQDHREVAAIIETNLIGSIHGAQVAMKGMLEQGSGSIYNMEGLGSDGRKVEGLTTYGTTKAALTYLTDAMVDEAKGTPVLVGAIQPGMVATDMILQQYKDQPEKWEEAKGVFNILADRPETVTPWIAERVLANTKNGARIQWLTRGKVMGRFLTARFTKRDIFAED